MKKTIAFLLTSILVLTLTSCNSTPVKENSNDTEEITSTTKVTDSVDTKPDINQLINSIKKNEISMDSIIESLSDDKTISSDKIEKVKALFKKVIDDTNDIMSYKNLDILKGLDKLGSDLSEESDIIITLIELQTGAIATQKTQFNDLITQLEKNEINIEEFSTKWNEIKTEINTLNGIEEIPEGYTNKPTKEVPETTPPKDKTPTFGSTVVCDGFEITFGTEVSWVVVDNEYSDYHNADVIAIPVSVKNIGEESDYPYGFFDFFNPDGNEIDSVHNYFDDDIFEMGKLRPGASSDAVVHILYEGDGDYYIEYDGWEDHFEIKLPISK